MAFLGTDLSWAENEGFPNWIHKASLKGSIKGLGFRVSENMGYLMLGSLQ